MPAISQTLQDAFNMQAVREAENANFYMNLSAICHYQGLNGFAHLFKDHHKEEQAHSRKFLHEVQLRQGFARLGSVAEQIPFKPEAKLLEICAGIYKREVDTTAQIQALSDMARKENDGGAIDFLDKFLKEQREEEKGSWRLWRTVKRIGGDEGALALLDKKMPKAAHW